MRHARASFWLVRRRQTRCLSCPSCTAVALLYRSEFQRYKAEAKTAHIELSRKQEEVQAAKAQVRCGQSGSESGAEGRAGRWCVAGGRPCVCVHT